MTDVKKLGHFIRETRLKRGLTQQQLADRVGVNASTITRYEQGRFMSVKWAVVRGILHAMNAADSFLPVLAECTQGDFFEYIEDDPVEYRPHDSENETRIVVDKIFCLNEEGRKKVSEYITDLIDSGKYKTHDIKSEEPKSENEK